MICILEKEYSEKDIKTEIDYIYIEIAGLRKMQITIRKIDDNSCMVGERILVHCKYTLESGEKDVELAHSKKFNIPYEEVKKWYVNYDYTIKSEGE